MAFTKTVKQAEYHIQIIKTLGVPHYLLEEVKQMFLNHGKINAIKKLRDGFGAHYGETMSLRDAKDIVEDMEKEFGLKSPFNSNTQTLGDILQEALKKHR